MMPRKLTEDEPKAVMGNAGPMRRVQSDASPPFDFWPYVEEIPVEDWGGHDFSAGRVTHVYTQQEGRFQFVNIDSEDKNVFLVVVLDLHERLVLGHFLLDLNREYGLTSGR
jgi:hypothetical protein